MTPQTKTYIFGTIGILVVVGLFWWGLERDRVTGEPIRVGVVTSLSGAGSFYGQNIQKGVQLAVDEINAAGGIHGRPLQVIYEDDATDPKQTVTAVRKLITTDDVVAIVGVQWDFLANAAIPLANELEVVVISVAAPFDSVLEEHQQSPFFFTTFPSAGAAEDAVEQFLNREQANTAVIMAVDNGWGAAHVAAYRNVADALGVDVLDVFRLVKTDGNDLRTELTRAQQLNPDVILLSANDADNITFIQRYREFGLKAAVLSHENISDTFYTGRVPLDNVDGFYFFEFPDPTEAFVGRYKKYHGEEPQISADTAYDAIYSLKQAMEKGGVTREGIAGGIRSVDFEGVSGPINFTTNNYPQEKKAILRQVVGGEIMTYDLAN